MLPTLESSKRKTSSRRPRKDNSIRENMKKLLREIASASAHLGDCQIIR